MSTPNAPQQFPGTPGIPGADQPFTADQSPYTGQPAAPVQPSYQPNAAQYPQPSYPAASTATTLDKTNTFALLAIIFAFLSPIAGIIFGHMGLSQIKRNGDAGRGIALTGLIISYAYFVFLIIFIVLYIGMIAVMIGSLGALSSGYDPYY
ncbi:DUF4190 domain-containing protein [Leucobacter rhizosphaerae]|uniref:DUF4190 domain-containing protein n=1 Tax=Leucobacter rhizosphaerae TaxID=2932245 RepID=A0ABY4FYH3_9MICO|nr:DUF4190 domain-containing protein [Leucobacter rhizosphaerae]UOQ61342.1 DUF4190 domain-containing protein [Leucobacter rhizosphaerae]